MSRQWVGPVGASLVHEAMRERWQHPLHQRFLDSWLADWANKREAWPQGIHQPTAVSQWKRHLWQGIRFAPLFALEEEPSALIAHAARTFRDQPLHPEDLPEPSGLVLCEYPIPSLDVKLREYDITGWMWTPGQDTDGQPGVVYCHFTGNQDIDDPFKSSMPPLSLLHISWLPFGKTPTQLEVVNPDLTPPAESVLASHRAVLTYMMSFWSFVQQRVLMVAAHSHPRAVRHRAERANVTLPTLNVIRLRRSDYGPVQPSDDPKHVDWRFRWIVSGHWRWWFFESEGRRRQVWVNPYIKGPEEKPLLKRKTVFAVER